MSAPIIIERLRNGGQPDIADEVDELRDLLTWAHQKLSCFSFSSMDDAMAMDRIDAALGKYDEVQA